MLNLKI